MAIQQLPAFKPINAYRCPECGRDVLSCCLQLRGKPVERSRLEAEVIKCAKRSVVVRDSKTDGTWADRVYAADADIYNATKALIASEAEE
jgi:hypothetical protein